MTTKDYLFNILSVRAYTEKEALKKLKSKKYPLGEIEEAIGLAKGYGYISDERYANVYALSQSDSKGTFRIKQELLEKGVDGELIKIALEQSEIDDRATCLKLVEKFLQNNQMLTKKLIEKLVRSLSYKGFSFAIIKTVFEELGVRNEEVIIDN